MAEKLSNETSRPESTNRPTFPDESSKIEFNDAVRFIKAVLPESSDDGLRKQEILDKRSGTDGNFSASTLDRALAWLGKQGEVGEKQLMNERGKPKVYWRAYNPLGDGEEGGRFISTKPPSRNGEDKREAAQHAYVGTDDGVEELSTMLEVDE